MKRAALNFASTPKAMDELMTLLDRLNKGEIQHLNLEGISPGTGVISTIREFFNAIADYEPLPRDEVCTVVHLLEMYADDFYETTPNYLMIWDDNFEEQRYKPKFLEEALAKETVMVFVDANMFSNVSLGRAYEIVGDYEARGLKTIYLRTKGN